MYIELTVSIDVWFARTYYSRDMDKSYNLLVSEWMKWAKIYPLNVYPMDRTDLLKQYEWPCPLEYYHIASLAEDIEKKMEDDVIPEDCGISMLRDLLSMMNFTEGEMGEEVKQKSNIGRKSLEVFSILADLLDEKR